MIAAPLLVTIGGLYAAARVTREACDMGHPLRAIGYGCAVLLLGLSGYAFRLALLARGFCP